MSKISESEFYMWRALFALAHADDVLHKDEVTYLAEILEDVPFTEEQTNTLRDDIYHPKNIRLLCV